MKKIALGLGVIFAAIVLSSCTPQHYAGWNEPAAVVPAGEPVVGAVPVRRDYKGELR